MIQNTFSLGQKEASHLFHILMECMERRESVSGVHDLSLGCLRLLLSLLFLWWVSVGTVVVEVMVLTLVKSVCANLYIA